MPTKKHESLDIDARYGLAQLQHAEAEAALFLAESKLSAAKQRYEDLIVKEKEEKISIESSVDFHHGYVNLSDAIHDGSVETVCAILRRGHRLHPNRDTVIEINSPGGSVIDGFQLYDEILQYRRHHTVTIKVRGQAASMAAVLLQAGDKRQAGPSSFIMLHRAAFGCEGKTYEVEDTLAFTRMLEQRIYDILDVRGDKPAGFWKEKLSQRKDMWFTAEEALALNLIDEIA